MLDVRQRKGYLGSWALPPRISPRWQLYAAIAGLFIVGHAVTFGRLDRDAAAYAYIGQRIAQGSVLYRDLWDHKPPGIHYWDALLSLLGLGDKVGLSVVDAVLDVAILILVWRIGRHFLGDRAHYAALLYAAMDAVPLAEPNMSERLLALLATLAYWSAIRARPSRSFASWTVAGLSLGAAAVVKPTSILDIACILGLLAYRVQKHRIRSGLLLVSTTAIFPSLVMVVLALQGVLADAYDEVVAFDRLYFQWGARQQLAIALALFLLLELPAIALVISALRRSAALPHLSRLLLGSWLAAALVEALSTGHGYLHYFLPFLPPLAIVAAAALTTVAYTGATKKMVQLLLPVAVAANLWLVAPVAINSQSGGRSGLASWVASCGAPGEPTLVWGNASEVYMALGRQAATKYFYNYPLIDRFGETTGRGYANDTHWQRFAADLDRRPPATLLVAPGQSANGPLAQLLSGYRPGPTFGNKWITYVRADLTCG